MRVLILVGLMVVVVAVDWVGFGLGGGGNWLCG